MSNESLNWLNSNVLVGFTEKRGNAWHYRKSSQAVEPNHYRGGIPATEVERRLFFWEPEEWPLAALVGDEPEAISRVEAIHLSPVIERAVVTPTAKAIYRRDIDAVIGVVGSNYTLHGYREWLLERVFDLLGEAGIGSAGLLEQGAKAWVQVEVPDTFRVDDVEFRPFLTAATALDGSMSTTYLTGAQVVVCDNTLRAAMSDTDAKKIRVRHSTRSGLDIGTAREALDVLDATRLAFEAQYKSLKDWRVSDEMFERFVRARFSLKDETKYRRHPQFERREVLRRLWGEDPRVAPWRGNAYGVVAAINTFEHHFSGRAEGPHAAERNAGRLLRGRFDQIDVRTLDLLREVA